MLPMPFDNPTTYPGHSGIDFPQPSGTPILASGRGEVTSRGWHNDRAGYGIIIQYDGGPGVLYCHHRDTDAMPKVGTRVSEGDRIGTVGSTGNSTGPHLHIETVQGFGGHSDADEWEYFDRSRVVGQAKAKRVPRTTAAFTNRRAEPNTNRPPLPDGLPKDAEGWFVGYVHGERVEGNDIWFVGHSGNYFWSGGFVGGADTSGLPKLH